MRPLRKYEQSGVYERRYDRCRPCNRYGRCGLEVGLCGKADFLRRLTPRLPETILTKDRGNYYCGLDEIVDNAIEKLREAGYEVEVEQVDFKEAEMNYAEYLETERRIRGRLNKQHKQRVIGWIVTAALVALFWVALAWLCGAFHRESAALALEKSRIDQRAVDANGVDAAWTLEVQK